MDEQAYKRWQVLHRRILYGEILSTKEQTDYEAGCQELDAQEKLDGNLEQLRTLHAQITEAKTQQQRFRSQSQDLDMRIASLEARLDTRTRELLGIIS